MTDTQNKMVLDYMKFHGSISSFEAYEELGITRLSGRIFDLRAAGHQIDTKSESRMNRWGKTVTYARYTLKGE